MTRWNLNSFVLNVSAAALLSACGGSQRPIGAPGTVPQNRGAVTAQDYHQSHMQPDAGKKSALIYVYMERGTGSHNDVFVYDYATGKQVGVLTGFDEPDGMCVDAKGDVYITNFGAGTTVEYAHGGSEPINTYNTGGEPDGCSVNAKGDLAVTIYNPGEAVIFAGGNPSKSTTYTSPCT